jgi:hypothetical protein
VLFAGYFGRVLKQLIAKFWWSNFCCLLGVWAVKVWATKIFPLVVFDSNTECLIVSLKLISVNKEKN